jgi:ABC-type transport system involved in multi-copper enzyme maturation permease subunit
MLTLIKREIADAVVFFMINAIFMSILAGMLVYRVAIGWGSNQIVGVPSVMYNTFVIFPFTFLPLIAAALGASQINSDRDKKISSFLTTLATTRQQILSAKIITGVLWILLIILPIAATDAVLLKVFPMIAVPDVGFLIRLFVTIFLCGVACYSFGLLIGWRSGKLVPASAIILVTPFLVSLMAIKGVGLQTVIFFVLFIFAAIIRTWQKFMSSSL